MASAPARFVTAASPGPRPSGRRRVASAAASVGRSLAAIVKAIVKAATAWMRRRSRRRASPRSIRHVVSGGNFET
jgi:hypothetical protein